MKTVSIELAKQLKDKEFPQENSYFYWTFWSSKEKPKPKNILMNKEEIKHGTNISINIKKIAAPIAEEILDQLPWSFRPKEDNMHEIEIFKTGKWSINYRNRVDGFSMLLEGDERIFETILADAAAQMWLYLKKNNLL